MFPNRKAIFGGLLGAVGLLVAVGAGADSVSIMPAGDGSFREWAIKTGVVHSVMVDEAACNGTTDYVYTNTVGARDSYYLNLDHIPNGALITGIDLAPCASRNTNGGGSSVMNLFYRFNGTLSGDIGSYDLPKSTSPEELAPNSWSNLALLRDSESLLQVGAVYSSGSRGVRLSRLAATLTYTPAPSAASASYDSNLGAVRISFADNSADEDYFRLERSVDGGAFSEIAAPAVSPYLDSTVSPEHAYGYRVRAHKGSGDTGYSNTASAIVPPAAPSDLAYDGSGLVWTDNSVTETGFRLERSLNGGGFADLATTSANATEYPNLSIVNGNDYSFRVRAFNDAGHSDYSNVLDVKTIPAVPLYLIPIPLGDGVSVALSWNDTSNNELYFEIERNVSSTGAVIIATTTQQYYYDLNLTPETAYVYRVRAVNGLGASAFSNYTTFTLYPPSDGGGDPPPPPDPDPLPI